MCSELHGSVFYHLHARQLFSMGALSPRRRRVVQLCREIPVCWPQCFSTGLFSGLRYNPIRVQRLFLPTFSGKTEKVGLRSNSRGVTATTAVPVNTDKRAGKRPLFFCLAPPVPSRTPRAFGSETAKYQWTMLCRCAIIFAKINHKHSLIQRYRKEDQYGGNQGELRR